MRSPSGSSGSAWRPRKNGCHGATVERHGTPLASHWSATGLVVSGVDSTIMRSIFSPVINSPATVGRAVGVGLAVLVDDLDRVQGVADLDPILEGRTDAIEDELVSLAKAGQRTSLRADEADLDRSTDRRARRNGTATVVAVGAAAVGALDAGADDAVPELHAASKAVMPAAVPPSAAIRMKSRRSRRRPSTCSSSARVRSSIPIVLLLVCPSTGRIGLSPSAGRGSGGDRWRDRVRGREGRRAQWVDARRMRRPGVHASSPA